MPVVGPLKEGGIYVGGHARLVEETLKLHAGEIMYVGDHVESDVHATKSILRWRTALVLRELEEEFACLYKFRGQQSDLGRMMSEKEKLEQKQAQIKLHVQRANCGFKPLLEVSVSELNFHLAKLEKEISALDENIVPLAKEAQKMFNPRWGLLTRSGYDKSYLARQLEGYADIYMSRVSNFLYHTPFAYLRSTRSSLPHDGGIVSGPHQWETAV